MAEQEIKAGQIWRRKKTGKLIVITGQLRDHDDWYWSGRDYKGKGISYGSYIRRDCELAPVPSGGVQATEEGTKIRGVDK